MKNKSIACLLFLLLLTGIEVEAQTSAATKEWTLRECIDYAHQNNIQLKKQQQTVEISKISLAQSKSELFPTLNAGATQAFTNQKDLQGGTGQEQSFTGNYSVTSDMILYNGSKLKNSILQNELSVKSGELGVQVSENDMELNITAAYLKILYARESVLNSRNALLSSELQFKRAKDLYDAGYIAESNYAQVQSQYSSDKYSLVLAINTQSDLILQLKQLLQLDASVELNISYPELDESQVMKAIPAMDTVINKALSEMPEIENSKVAIEIAGKDLEIAKAGLLPSLSLSASMATGYNSTSTGSYATQLGNNFYQNAGLSLRIPIFNNKQVKSSIAIAKIGVETARLSQAETQVDLTTRIETAYLDALASQSRFQAASEQLGFIKISYSLVEEQFNLGMKNTVELLTEKTKYLSAQQEYLQAKYTAILNYKILDFYQNKPIVL